MILSKLKHKLDEPLISTGHRPPVAMSVDKMTQKHRSGQITAVAALFPEAPAKKMIQTFLIGNPPVRDLTGEGLANVAIDQFKKVLNFDYISSQLVGGGTDGQYFGLHFEDHLTDKLSLLKPFYSWDPAHRVMLAEK